MKSEYAGDHAVPYYSQKADFLSKEGSLEPEQIDEWKDSLCGLMCVGMIINRFSTDSRHTIAEFLNSARQLGAFDQQRRWVHRKIVRLALEYGIKGKAQGTTDLNTVYQLLTTGNLIIASVSPNYLHPELKGKLDERNGHLVVITGMSPKEIGGYQIFVHDPGSEITEGGQNLVVDSRIFECSFSGNIIAFKNPQL